MRKPKIAPQPKLDRVIREKTLLGAEKELFVYPVRIDTAYIIIKSSQASLPLDLLYPEISEYYKSKGFSKTVHPQTGACDWRNGYGLTVFFGKTHQIHNHKSLKIQMSGEFLIYKNAEKIARSIAKDMKGIGIKRGILLDSSFSRVGPSFLVIADEAHDIIPKPSDKIFVANGMEYTPRFYKDRPSELSGFQYANSRFSLKVYDKLNQLNNTGKSKEYIKYYKLIGRTALAMGKKLYRVELETYNESHLFDYGKSFFGKDWEQEHEEEMKALFNKFIKHHSFRQVPEKQRDLWDKRNRGRWREDVISNLLFFGEQKAKVESLEAPNLQEFRYKSHKPSKINTIELFIKKAAKDLARIDPNLDLCSLNEIKAQIATAYNNVKHEIEESYRERVLRQTAFRMAYAENSLETDLIEREKHLLLAKLNVKEDFHFEVKFRHILKDARKEMETKELLGFSPPRTTS